MRYSAAIIALAAAASAKYIYGNETVSSTSAEFYTTTEVVSSYETYCSSAMIYVEGTKTYSVTEPTTLTISECPYGCTITRTYTSSHPENTGTGYPQSKPSYLPSKPSYLPSKPSYPPSKPSYPPALHGTGSYGSTNTTKPSYHLPTETPLQGGSGRVTVVGGALAGLLAVVAYLL
jgi:hypothetical protein